MTRWKESRRTREGEEGVDEDKGKLRVLQVLQQTIRKEGDCGGGEGDGDDDDQIMERVGRYYSR